ncbi:MAG TPA: hypothetical protein VN745_03135 [Verrucomicrobiae bacterium]|nr:hypothetical protein [Verrucomicrobiae bacterium]
MKTKTRGLILVLAALALTAGATIAMAQEDTDFLSPSEADKVRNAINPNDRIRLFVAFAGDRLKKLQYELQLTSPQMHKEQILKGLLSAYSHCMDEASDRIEEARDHGAQIRSAIKDMQKHGKDYLQTLQGIESAKRPELDSYKDSLDDAIDGTQDALKSAAKASKEYGATPVRRKP